VGVERRELMWSETKPGRRRPAPGHPVRSTAKSVVDQNFVNYDRSGDLVLGTGNTSRTPKASSWPTSTREPRGPSLDRRPRPAQRRLRQQTRRRLAARGLAGRERGWRSSPPTVRSISWTRTGRPRQADADQHRSQGAEPTSRGRRRQERGLLHASGIESVPVGTKPSAPKPDLGEAGVVTFLPAATDKVEHITRQRPDRAAIAARRPDGAPRPRPRPGGRRRGLADGHQHRPRLLGRSESGLDRGAEGPKLPGPVAVHPKGFARPADRRRDQAGAWARSRTRNKTPDLTTGIFYLTPSTSWAGPT